MLSVSGKGKLVGYGRVGFRLASSYFTLGSYLPRMKKAI